MPNEDGSLRPGLFATASLVSSDEEMRLLIPRKAVQYAGEAAKVLVVKDGKAREVVVALGAAEGDDVTVTGGLSKGDVVLADGTDVPDGAVIQ